MSAMLCLSGYENAATRLSRSDHTESLRLDAQRHVELAAVDGPLKIPVNMRVAVRQIGADRCTDATQPQPVPLPGEPLNPREPA